MQIVVHNGTMWPKADDVSDGIAAVTYRDPDGSEQIRVYYPSGGKIVEMGHGIESAWYRGEFTAGG
jgi:hypothetical protein